MPTRIALFIALGGAIGSLLRSYVALRIEQRFHSAATGTLVINVLGCFLLGLLYQGVMSIRTEVAPRAFVITGILGGFTTFSAFGGQAFAFLQSGHRIQAIVYALGQMLIAVAAVAIGDWLGRRWTG